MRIGSLALADCLRSVISDHALGLLTSSISLSYTSSYLIHMRRYGGGEQAKRADSLISLQILVPLETMGFVMEVCLICNATLVVLYW